MIRPLTCVCFLLACGAGLYVYQVKHRVTLIDQQIERTVRATEATREQIRLLHAEWTRRGKPDRLQALVGQFLTLTTTRPSQFTAMAELDARLPPVPPPPAQHAASPPVAVSVVSAIPAEPPPATPSAPARRDAIDHLSAAEAKPVPPGTTQADATAPAPRPAPPIARPRPAVVATAVHPVWPPRRPAPLTPPPQPAPQPGSLLGMARASASTLAPPAPMPVDEMSRANGN